MRTFQQTFPFFGRNTVDIIHFHPFMPGQIGCRLEAGAGEALSNQVHRFGRAADEDDFLRIAGIDEATNRFACAFVGIGRTLGEFMRRAMDVRVLVFVEIRDAVDGDSAKGGSEAVPGGRARSAHHRKLDRGKRREAGKR